MGGVSRQVSRDATKGATCVAALRCGPRHCAWLSRVEITVADGSHLEGLVALTADAVDSGASVNWLASAGPGDFRGFWVAALADPTRLLLVALQDGRVDGCVLLALAPQQNAPHRAEVGKMLVHTAARRRGLGRQLLEAVEALALSHHRTLLLLDTEQGSAGESLYAACGWTRYGEVPGHALSTAGVPSPTTFFYKRLA